MSDLWLNWRAFYWHFQIGRHWPWVRLGFNGYHVGKLWRPWGRLGPHVPASPWFEVY